VGLGVDLCEVWMLVCVCVYLYVVCVHMAAARVSCLGQMAGASAIS
jgi:hypothetical protein